MPKCQFLFSTVFGFRNPSKEIFSKLDEINAQYLIFQGSFQSTEEGPEESQVGPTHGGGAAKRGGAPPWCGEPPWPFRLRLFAYKSPFDLKTQYQLTKLQKDSRGAATVAKLQFGGQNSVPAPCRDGEVPPEAISINATASIMLRE